MKKFGVILLFGIIGLVGGVYVATLLLNSGVVLSQPEFVLSENREEIKPTNIIEYGDFVYYVLPQEDNPVMQNEERWKRKESVDRED